MVQKLDRKFHGVVVKDKDGTIVPPDQYIVFLAKDNAVPKMLDTYYDECERLGAELPQLNAVADLLNRVAEWRRTHKDECKVPDVHPGEIE
jgi:hypothetical protein